jgi:hypothetical protein
VTPGQVVLSRVVMTVHPIQVPGQWFAIVVKQGRPVRQSLLTGNEAAPLIGCAPMTITNWRRAGVLKRCGARFYRVADCVALRGNRFIGRRRPAQTGSTRTGP